MIRSTLRGLAAATVLLVAVSSTASAQAASGSRFGLSAGVALPMGDFADVADMGFQIGGAYTMKLNDQYALRFNADWSRYAVADNPLFDGNWSQLGIMANATAGLKDNPLYGLVGLGFVNTKLSVDGGGSDSNSDFAFNVGAGFNQSRWAVEARYQSVQADGGSINSIPLVFIWKF